MDMHALPPRRTKLPTLRRLTSAARGRRQDWLPARPSFRPAGPKAAWIGPAAIAASALVGWFAFAGAGGSVALGLYVGSVAIVLMAWSFILALRLRWLEPWFGGLDSMYKVHRWIGSLAIPAMFLHARLEPEVDNGIRGAAESIADSAEGLAGVAEISLYALVAISLIRWFPYRFWRLTHKFLGIPFALACWHFFTATKTYANNSLWGWYFGTLMLAGVAAFMARVIGRDMVVPGHRHHVSGVVRRGTTTELRLKPAGSPLTHRIGQFAVLKVQLRGLREPHVFTIASAPADAELRFFIRDLGDWTKKIQAADLIGSTVLVEGPYGRFDPIGNSSRPPLWVAGGVGITPFLGATSSRPPAAAEARPRLLYCVSSRADATAMAELQQAHHQGRIALTVIASDEGARLTKESLAGYLKGDLHGRHVAVCGPKGLVATVSDAARAGGAAHLETEDFDIRSGVGPDLSEPIDQVIAESRRLRPA